MVSFGSVQLDVGTRELRLNGQLQHLEPQAFDLLVHLVNHRTRVVSKAELLDEIWGDQFVSESALTTRIKEVRRATGDDGRSQSVVKNFRGRGYRFVAQLDPPGDGEDASSVAETCRVPPEPMTPSVGIEAEIARLAELAESRRLITIVGSGGVGKTRLSVEVGRAVAGRHVLGTRIAELSRLSEPEAIVPTIRRALDLGESDSGMADGLGAIDALLVLDNCEHLIDAVAAIVPHLLSGGDCLRILATSREALGVPGEQRWALAPLSTVGLGAPALSLFVERAKDVAVEVDPADPLVASIVAQLDGIPLALEMAAPRLATMSVADLEREIATSFASLRAVARGVSERHSTLRAVLAWSEALLTPQQRTVLADFSVFAGPVEASDLLATVDAADPVEEIRSLAERSLVSADTVGHVRTQYGLLETVREFSRERLVNEGRLNDVAGRHARWFADQAERVGATYDTANQVEAVARVDDIFDELRAAHRWARTHDHSLAMRISRALFQPAFQELRLEVFHWSLALAQVVKGDVDYAAALYGDVAQGLTFLGRLEEARSWADRSVKAMSDPVAARGAYAALADLGLYDGNLGESEEIARRFVELADLAASPLEHAYGTVSLALAVAYLGRRSEALSLIPDPEPTASPIANAWLAYGRGEVMLDSDPQVALRELDTAIALAESVNGHFLSGVAQVSAASLRARTGQVADAVGPLKQTIRRLADRGNLTHLLTTLRNLPALLVRVESWHGAAEILGGLSVVTISPTYGDEAERLAAADQAARSALGDEAFAQAYQAGTQRRIDETARRAISILESL